MVKVRNRDKMPLVRVSEKTKKRLDKIKKKNGFASHDVVIWRGIRKLANKKQRDKFFEPTMDFDLFEEQEDFSL